MCALGVKENLCWTLSELQCLRGEEKGMRQPRGGRGGLSDLSTLCNSGGMKMKMVSRQKAAVNSQRSPTGETQ